MALHNTSRDQHNVESSEMKPIERLMPPISYIVARSNPGGVIGCENELPWKLRTDLKFFKSVTKGHVIIMGRRTLESLGRPLPNRVNIVLSTNPGEDRDNLIWAKDRETALHLADVISILRGYNQIIVVGGAQIYKLFADLFTKIYLTEVYADLQCGDAYFKENFDRREWNVINKREYKSSEFDQYDFSISMLEKRIKYTRHKSLDSFYVRDEFYRAKTDFSTFVEKFKVSSFEEEQILLPMLVA